MRLIPLDLEGVHLIELDPQEDARGYFARSYCEDTFRAAGLETSFPQHNVSFNKLEGTVRGMHYQLSPNEETKVVSCHSGAIDDVVVDLRPGSPSYKRHLHVRLDSTKLNGLYVPRGFAHGFQTLTDATLVTYLMGARYVPNSSAGFCWDDPEFGIKWSKPVSVLSQRDKSYPSFIDGAGQ